METRVERAELSGHRHLENRGKIRGREEHGFPRV